MIGGVSLNCVMATTDHRTHNVPGPQFLEFWVILYFGNWDYMCPRPNIHVRNIYYTREVTESLSG